MTELELTTSIDEHGKPRVTEHKFAGPLFFENGTAIGFMDLGFQGVRITMIDPQKDPDEATAIILDAEEVEKVTQWFSTTLGQKFQQLPNEFVSMLERFVKTRSGFPVILRRGDKRRLKIALGILQEHQYRYTQEPEKEVMPMDKE